MLRTDQTEALENLRTAVGNGARRICMQAPTGFGKTVLSAKLVANALAKGRKVLFTVPAISLIDQTIEMFYKLGIMNVGVIQATHHMTDWSQPVQVASVQTLMRRPLPDAHVALVDESHIMFEFYGKWFCDPKWSNIPIIGLSATPWAKGMGTYYKHFIKASTTADLIEAGLLSPFKVYAPSHPDLSDVRTVAGDYHEGELSAKMQDGRLVADTVDTWLRLAERRPTLCYAVDRAHAKHLQQKFEAAGVRCGYQDAHTDDIDRRSKNTGEWIEGRKTIKRKFHSGEYPVVCSVGTLTVGIDWDVRCISMCRPTKSDMLFVQIIGRGLRTAEGKDHCLILDHSDNHARLGFVTDIDDSYIGLHVGKTPAHDNRTNAIVLPKECPACAYLKPPKTATCPACGFTTKAVNGIKAEAGELRELKPKPKTKSETVDKVIFIGELRCYAKEHRKSAGWVSHTFRERFGVWPNAYGYVNASARVSRDTANWIRHRMIAYARMKAKEQASHP